MIYDWKFDAELPGKLPATFQIIFVATDYTDKN
jgi:hypothetical protein